MSLPEVTRVDDEDCCGLLTWLEHKAGKEISKVVTVGKSSNRGRGLFAAEDIQKGDCILKIPSTLYLSQNDIHPILRRLKGHFGQGKLALKILMEMRQGEDSEWKNYMDCLPRPEDMHSSMFWSVDELQIIKGSFVYRETCKLKNKVYEQLWKMVNSMPNLFGNLNTRSEEMKRIKRQFMYSFGLALSRGRKNAKSVVYLAPFLDFLNHDNSSMVVVETQGEYTEVKADRDSAKGDEIFGSYGNLSNSRLLVFYGFVVLYNANDFLLLVFYGFVVPDNANDFLVTRYSVAMMIF